MFLVVIIRTKMQEISFRLHFFMIECAIFQDHISLSLRSILQFFFIAFSSFDVQFSKKKYPRHLLPLGENHDKK
jgi:hypothetical protein